MAIFWYLYKYVKFLGCNTLGLLFFKSSRTLSSSDLSSFFIGFARLLCKHLIRQWHPPASPRRSGALLVFYFFSPAENWRKPLRCLIMFFSSTIPSWWLNQPIWKRCSSNWTISPVFGVKTQNVWAATTYKRSCSWLNSEIYWGRWNPTVFKMLQNVLLHVRYHRVLIEVLPPKGGPKFTKSSFSPCRLLWFCTKGQLLRYSTTLVILRILVFFSSSFRIGNYIIPGDHYRSPKIKTRKNRKKWQNSQVVGWSTCQVVSVSDYG